MAAGFACLNEVAQPGVHETLDELTTRLAEGLLEAAKEAGIPLVVNHVGGMFTQIILLTLFRSINYKRLPNVRSTYSLCAFTGLMF